MRLGAGAPDGADLTRYGAFDFIQVTYRQSLRREWPPGLVLVPELDDWALELILATLGESTRYGVHAPLVLPGTAPIESIVSVAELAARHGRRVLVENGEASPTEWRDRLRELPAELVGCCLDLGDAHVAGAGYVGPAVAEPALAYVSRFAERIEAVHLSDADGNRRHLPLGHGSLALATVAAALRDCGVDAPVVLEIDGAEADLAQSLALARDLW